MEILNLAFIYKKQKTLRYVTFLHTKILTLCKEQDNLRYTLIYKMPDILRYTNFMEFFKLSEGGGGIYTSKKILHFVLKFYKQKTFTLR